MLVLENNVDSAQISATDKSSTWVSLFHKDICYGQPSNNVTYFLPILITNKNSGSDKLEVDLALYAEVRGLSKWENKLKVKE